MSQRQLLLKKLAQGLSPEISKQITPSVQEKLIEYIELLHKWNAIHNLTAIQTPEEMVDRHLLDSLTLYPLLLVENPKTVLDVGTGPGLPGIILAISRPETHFVLLDSHQKKLNFVQHVVLSLKLSNVTVVCSRVEHYPGPSSQGLQFDWIISRAYASLKTFVESTAHLSPELGKGRWIAMKGRLEKTELEELPEAFSIEEIQKVSVPGSTYDRCLVKIIRRKTNE